VGKGGQDAMYLVSCVLCKLQALSIAAENDSEV